MKTIAHVLLAAIVTSGLMALPLHAEEQVQRYIVVLKQRSGAVPDVASLGGKIEFRQDDQLVVTIPPGALAALKADPKVRYVERVGGTPSDDETPLVGAPSDPQPGPSTQAARFTPHALGSLAWDSGPYAYDGAGNIVSIGTDNYLYDGVQRLHQSSTQGTPETYTYDGFGNMTGKTNNGQAQIVPPVETATNRYTGSGYTYTEAGAVKTDSSYAFSYDALGQPLSKIYNSDSSKLEYYIYTPGDERIGVQRGGWWIWSVRDEGGKVLRQYKSSATNPTAPALWLEDFVWRDGLLLGSQRPVEMGGRRHFHLDHLGSPRLITADNGQMVSYHDYYPFGDEHSPVWQEGPSAGGFDREEPMKFTGHERDYASGMGGEDGHAIDDMHARYYEPTMGRFVSVDPITAADGPLKPQHWNRYSYSFNSPLGYSDPTGSTVYNQLNSADSAQLLDALRGKTGLDLYYDDKNTLQSHGQMHDADGNALGSATAAADVLSAIAPGSSHIIQSDSHVWIAQNTGAVTKMNFGDIRQIRTGQNPSATFDAASILIHEMIGHGSKGLFDFPGQQTNNQSFLLHNPNWKGAVVDYDNKIRRELGLPERSQYQTKQDNQNKTYIPFENGPVYLPAEHH